jgi:hypothetical protein
VVDVVCDVFVFGFHGLKNNGAGRAKPQCSPTRYEQCKYNVFVK